MDCSTSPSDCLKNCKELTNNCSTSISLEREKVNKDNSDNILKPSLKLTYASNLKGRNKETIGRDSNFNDQRFLVLNIQHGFSDKSSKSNSLSTLYYSKEKCSSKITLGKKNVDSIATCSVKCGAVRANIKLPIVKLININRISAKGNTDKSSVKALTTNKNAAVCVVSNDKKISKSLNINKNTCYEAVNSSKASNPEHNFSDSDAFSIKTAKTKSVKRNAKIFQSVFCDKNFAKCNNTTKIDEFSNKKVSTNQNIFKFDVRSANESFSDATRRNKSLDCEARNVMNVNTANNNGFTDKAVTTDKNIESDASIVIKSLVEKINALSNNAECVSKNKKETEMTVLKSNAECDTVTMDQIIAQCKAASNNKCALQTKTSDNGAEDIVTMYRKSLMDIITNNECATQKPVLNENEMECDTANNDKSCTETEKTGEMAIEYATENNQHNSQKITVNEDNAETVSLTNAALKSNVFNGLAFSRSAESQSFLNMDSVVMKQHIECSVEGSKVENFTTLNMSPKHSESDFNSPRSLSEQPKVLVQMLPVFNFEFGNVSSFQTGKKCDEDLNSVNSVQYSEPRTRRNFRNDLKKCSNLEPSDILSCKMKTYCRRKHALNFHVPSGQGIKLKDIDFVASNLEKASRTLLRMLHYVLFTSYGLSKTEESRDQTIQNILQFSGYVFSQNSLEFKKKQICLTRIPLPALKEMYKALFMKKCPPRSQMVEHLLNFFMKPQKGENPTQLIMKNSMEAEALKKLILEGPTAVVVLQRLKQSDVDKMTKKKYKKKHQENEFQSGLPYFKPTFIQKGPGLALKKFRKILKNVMHAPVETIMFLHYFLFGFGGTTYDAGTMRRNILEFNGFSDSQRKFSKEREITLCSVKSVQVRKMCEVLSLGTIGFYKKDRIPRIMNFLLSPRKLSVRPLKKRLAPTALKEKTSQSLPRLIQSKSSKSKSQNDQINKLLKLGDFEKIRHNIECATPIELKELNDLLFLMPTEECDIHEKILECSRFEFPEESSDMWSRKTVLQYLSFESLQKISHQLDIQNREGLSTSPELSAAILHFLKHMKQHSVEHQVPISRSSPVAFPSQVDSEENKNVQPIEYVPTNTELQVFIEEVIQSGRWSCKNEDLTAMVLHQYPNINLEEKRDFIETKAKDILLENRKRAFDSIAQVKTWY